MASLIVGILGPKRSGKDTVANRLVSHHGFTRIGFADALKAAALDLDPYVYATSPELRDLGELNGIFRRGRHVRLSTIVQDHGWEAAKEVADVRRLLQRFGSDAIRDNVDPDAWVNAIRRRIAATPGAVVIPDVRFDNELAFIYELSGLTVRVTRPGLASTDTHVSETALGAVGARFILRNDSTVAALHDDVDRLFSHLV